MPDSAATRVPATNCRPEQHGPRGEAECRPRVVEEVARRIDSSRKQHEEEPRDQEPRDGDAIKEAIHAAWLSPTLSIEPVGDIVRLPGAAWSRFARVPELAHSSTAGGVQE